MTDLEKIKKHFQESINFAIKNNEDLDDASWHYQEGILLSCNEAKFRLINTEFALFSVRSVQVENLCFLDSVSNHPHIIDLRMYRSTWRRSSLMY